MSILAGIETWAIDVIDKLGYIGVGGLVALETIIPPIPSEVILPLAGFQVAAGRFSFPLVVGIATVGSLIGALVLYGMGYWFGPERLRRFVARTGRYVLVSVDDLDNVQAKFDRYGAAAVLGGRVVPGVRSLISLPAGLVRMPLGRFVLYTAIGSAAWNGLLVGLGWALRDQWKKVSNYASFYDYLVLGAIGGGVIWFIWSRVNKRRTNRIITHEAALTGDEGHV